MELLPCRPYKAMLTAEACRKRQSMEKARYVPGDVVNRTLKCIDCRGVSGTVKEVNVAAKMIVCADCGRTIPLKAKGLCGKCYDRKYQRQRTKARPLKPPAISAPVEQDHIAGPGKMVVAGKESMPDVVNHPPHYTTGQIEVIDFIEDQGLGYHDGNVVKYVCRHRHKGTPLQDLKKARWYLDRLIERLSATPAPPAPEAEP